VTDAAAAPHRPRQDGTIVTLLGTALAAGALVLVLLVDATAYLAAAARAQAAADAAALAAVAVADPRGRTPGHPTREAERVTRAAAARLEACRCPPGATRVDVSVSVRVPGIVVPRLAAQRVTAEATGELRPPW
jgi:hypothetical protein